MRRLRSASSPASAASTEDSIKPGSVTCSCASGTCGGEACSQSGSQECRSQTTFELWVSNQRRELRRMEVSPALTEPGGFTQAPFIVTRERERERERGTALRPDLLCGGFPCQDLSVAGRRAGLAGDRSGLFFEFARIIDALQPRWILIENVPGLLSSQRGGDFGVVLETLADLGYGVAWRILDSRFFGVPQRRRRVFIVGTLADGDPRAAAERAGEVLAVGARCPGHPATGGKARKEAAVASLSGLGSGGPDDNDGQGGRLVSSTLKAHAGKGGSGIGPEDTFVAATLVKRYGKGADSDATDTLIADTLREHPRPGSNSNGAVVVTHALTSEGHDASEDGTGRGTPIVSQVAGPLGGGNDGIGRRSEDDPNLVLPYTFDWQAGGSSERTWIHDTPGHTRSLTKTKTLATVAAAVVRRLTPRECERLQGLPDDWTLVPDTAPDSRRYSALGDAVTVNVAEWIGRRIFAAIQAEAA